MEDVPGDGIAARRAQNRERQRELYGAPLGDLVRRLTAALGISQARLARALGISPAMLSQLVSARRVKIGDPAVLARLLLLDRCSQALPPRPEPHVVDGLLADAARTRWQWTEPPAAGPSGARRLPVRRMPDPSAAAVLRGIAEPARLTAAAAALGPGFPELAEVLRQAAGRPAG
ncbi:hypothetical protein BJF78_18600 [Pseudonocardia sp. CNS-139]|nr:hypothetical protein BJF78_18600 [Pseudonocardia sp. CNS-139]